MCWWSLMSYLLSKHVSGLGNQHNNGPHQEQVFDNPSALCLALGEEKSDLALERTEAPNRFWLKGVSFQTKSVAVFQT